MKIEYDKAKNQLNIEKRGLSFELVADFNFQTALVVEDDRIDYGEIRYQALGFIEDRLHALVFTVRNDAVRVISLRKANQREVTKYGQIKKS